MPFSNRTRAGSEIRGMWIKARGDAAIITCRVHPNTGRDAVKEVRDDQLVINLSAPAVEGKANEALVRFLSKRLKVAKSRISLIQGEKNRNKVVAIEGMDPSEVASCLKINQ